MSKISIVGIGPGHPDYMLPMAKKIIDDSDVLIGGRRQLEAVAQQGKKTVLLEGNYTDVIKYISENHMLEKIAVVVSGDTGFHSLLGYLKRNLTGVSVLAIPGICSLQYLFARVGLSWESARFCSAHGRELDEAFFYESTCLGILTDQKNTPVVIAEKIRALGHSDWYMVVGEDLSYPNEKIQLFKISEMQTGAFSLLNAIIALPPDEGAALEKEMGI